MYTQRIVVKNMSFLCFRVPLKVHCFCTISWFISLNRIFIRLFNDNKLKCILPIPYYILLKNGSCAKRPLRGVV